MSTKKNAAAKKSDQKPAAAKSAKAAATKRAPKAKAWSRDVEASAKQAAEAAMEAATDIISSQAASVDNAPAPQFSTCERCGRTDVALRDDGRLTLHDAPSGVACNLAAAPVQRDAVDLIIMRAQATTAEALPFFLEAQSPKHLRAMVERLTGEKVDSRLSSSGAIERIKTALGKAAMAPSAAAEAEPASVQPEAADVVAAPLVGAPSEGEPIAPAPEPATPSCEDAAPDVMPTSGQPVEEVAAPPAKESRATATRDLPPVGTIVVKRGRTGAERARCVVVDGGVEYAGTIHKSLSGAALAAAHDLGLTTKQLNGWAWWGLAERPSKRRAPKGVDLDGIAKAWDRYRERVEDALKTARPDEKARLHLALDEHSTTLLHLAAESAAE